MRKSPRISFPLTYFHPSVRLKIVFGSWLDRTLKERPPFSYRSLPARTLLPVGPERGGQRPRENHKVAACARGTCASKAPGNLTPGCRKFLGQRSARCGDPDPERVAALRQRGRRGRAWKRQILTRGARKASVKFSSVVSDSLRPHEPWHARPPCPLPTPGGASFPLSQWCHPTISSSVVPFSSCLQSCPASGSFQMGQLFLSSGQSTGSFSFNISPFNEHPRLISFRMDWLDLLAVQGTLKSLLLHHSSKASILQHSAFFMVQLSHPYMTTGKTIALTRRTFVGKVMSLLFNMLSRFVIAFLSRSKCLLISWLQSPSVVILEPPKIKSVTVSTVSPSICHEVMGPDAILVFCMLSFKPTFSLSSLTFIKRLFSSSSLSAIRLVSSAYLRLLIFLPASLIPVCASLCFQPSISHDVLCI